MVEPWHDELLDAAIDALQDNSYVSFANHWRGTGSLDPTSGKSPRNARCIAVEYARLAVADFDQACVIKDADSIAAATNRLNTLATMMDAILSINKHDIKSEHIANAVPLCHAIAHGVLAGITTKVPLPGEATQEVTIQRQRDHLAQASHLYEEHWGLGFKAIPRTIDTGHSVSSGAEKLLRDSVVAFDPQGISESTWLTLHALLSRILDTANPQCDHANTMRLLMVSGPVDDRKGFVVPITVSEMTRPSRCGVYIDPISFGITLFDDQFRASIQLAYRCCHQHLLAHNGQPVSLCLTAEILGGFPRFGTTSGGAIARDLGGPSAGGLIAATLIATARGRRLNASRTATCQLLLTSSTSENDTQGNIDPTDLKFEKIGGLFPKIRDAAVDGITGVALCESDEQKYRKLFPDAQYPEVRVVKDLAELIEWLCLREDCEIVLKDRCTMHQSAWKAAAEAIDGEENPDFDHRFACYVPQRLSIESPAISEDETGRAAKSAGLSPASRSRETYEITGDSHSDEGLLNLIAFAYGNVEFSEAPKRLRWHRKTVIYDNAGAGKTVCSHRIKHLLSDARCWRRLLGMESPPLVVRIENVWPCDQGHDLTIRETLINSLATRSINSHLLAATVDQALATHRVVIIVDGFDQLSTDQQQHIAKLIRDADRDADDALYYCRWFVTSRVHSLDEQAGLFTDDRWTQVRIDPFDQSQQDQYFELAGVGEHWESMVDRNSMSELLELPMVLRMLLEFIEFTKESAKVGDGNSEPLTAFKSESQLALVTTRLLLARALDRNIDPNTGLVKTKSGTPIPRPENVSESQQLTLLEHALTVMAFECRLNPDGGFRIDGDSHCSQFLVSCRNRFLQHSMKLEQIPSYVTTNGWQWAVEVLKTIELNHRSVTERFAEQQIAFRSLKMVECHAARYLTRYATYSDISGSGDARQPFAWQYISDERWKRTWELAMDMPSKTIPGRWPKSYKHAIKNAVHDPQTACRSLSVLFRPTLNKTRRPTELIWRCWPLFEFDKRRLLATRYHDETSVPSKHDSVECGLRREYEQLAKIELLGEIAKDQDVAMMREACLKEFRHSSNSLVDEIESRFDTVCITKPGLLARLKRILGFNLRAPVPAENLKRKCILARWQEQSHQEKSLTFLQCPPQSWIEAYEANPNSMNDPRINDAIRYHESNTIQPIRIQTTAVTRGMYQVFDAAINLNAAIAPTFSGTPSCDFPVVEVNWYDAWVFGKWLGPQYRLLTAFEWELACRGGAKSDFHFGAEIDKDSANFGAYQSGCTPAGSARYPSNEFGLFDVHGNVWEWCEDYHDRTLNSQAREHGIEARELRGGSWNSKPQHCTALCRDSTSASRRQIVVGFRLCRECD